MSGVRLTVIGLASLVALAFVRGTSAPDARGQSTTRSESPAPVALPDLIARQRDSVVAVGTYNPLTRPTGQFLGSGFAIAGRRLVATNWHVVEPIFTANKGKELRVFGLNDRISRGRSCRLFKEDADHDLALIEYDGPMMPGLALVDAGRPLREGDEIAFTGYPLGPVLGLHPATHIGIISSIGPRAIPADVREQLTPTIRRALENPFDVYQLDAVAFPGHSGSPVYLRSDGSVIGIINSAHVQLTKERSLVGATGICYAIPAEHLAKMLE